MAWHNLNSQYSIFFLHNIPGSADKKVGEGCYWQVVCQGPNVTQVGASNNDRKIKQMNMLMKE